MRLEHVLSAYALDPSDDRREEARLRLDIMLGRLELLQQGNLRAFIQDDTQRRALFLKLSDILHRLDAGFDQLNDESLRQQLQAMAMLDGPMTALASAAVEYDVGLIDTAGRSTAAASHLYRPCSRADPVWCCAGSAVVAP